jgi:hypothetical protein
LVANISSVPDILTRHGLAPADLKKKMADKMWVSAYKEAKAMWSSDLNVQARIRFKAGLLLEDALEDLMLIIKDPMQAPSQKLEATKQLDALSGTSKPKGSESTGSKFTVNINLGGNQKGVTIDGYAVPQPAIE